MLEKEKIKIAVIGDSMCGKRLQAEILFARIKNLAYRTVSSFNLGLDLRCEVTLRLTHWEGESAPRGSDVSPTKRFEIIEFSCNGFLYIKL